VTFSEPVLNVSGSSFSLRDASGRRLDATVSYEVGSQGASLKPSAALPPGEYEARLNSTITDRAGNQLPFIRWRFHVPEAPSG
jgi:hypothetical protein